MSHNYSAAALAFDANLYIACHILPEIYYSLALRRDNKFLRGNPLMLMDELAHLRNKLCFHAAELSSTEFFYSCRRVYRLAVIYLGIKYLRGTHAPCIVCGKMFLSSVGIFHIKPRDNTDRIGENMVSSLPCEVTDCPALCRCNGNFRALAAEKRRDVIRLILSADMV